MIDVIIHVCLLLATICSTTTGQYVPARMAQQPLPRMQILENKLKYLTNEPFNDFDWKLSKVLAKNIEGNLVVSPLSVKLALSMLYLGVQGKAAKEIEEALKINSTIKNAVEEKFSGIMKSLESKAEAYELNVGTTLFLDKSALVHKEFEAKLKNYYNTTVRSIEFKQKAAAIAEINEWCSKITKGKIQQLITDENINDGTVMMLLNAIYFRGQWENPFPENETKYDTFWTSNTKQVNVQMMSLKQKLSYYNIQELKAHLFRLPYVGDKFAMYVIYPYDIEGLATLANNITPEILAKSLKQMEDRILSLCLPKFKFETTAALVPILEMLNIKELFSPKANLDNLGKGSKGPFTISDIIQKSGIEVNEKGSTAYAATNVIIDTKFGMEAMDLKINHPFVFLIADESKDLIIFLGKVVDPSTFEFPSLSPSPSGQPEADMITERIKPAQSEELNDRYNYFDKELLSTIFQTNPDSNVIVSPASIKAMLALLLEGASGKTEKEIIDALRLPKDRKAAVEILQSQLGSLKNADSAVIIESKNKVYVAQDEKLSQRYSNTIIERYDTQSEQINFNKPEDAANMINTWTKNVTKGLIPTLVSKDDFDSTTKLFLANCIYFKGEWLMEFDSRYTRTNCFYDSLNNCRMSTFMHSKIELNYFEANDLDAKLVEIPFKDERYSLVIILPNKYDGVANLLRDLHHKSLLDLFGQMKKSQIDITIPRTTIEFALPLNDALKELNIRDMFGPAANLSGLLDMNKSIAVSKMIHKAKIEINEKGAKAAAATGVQVVLLIASSETEFRADHPFIFFIRDNRESGFLFEGILTSPDIDPAPPKQSPISNRLPQPQPTPSILRNTFPTSLPSTTRRQANTKRPVVGFQAPRPMVNGSVEYPIYETSLYG